MKNQELEKAKKQAIQEINAECDNYIEEVKKAIIENKKNKKLKKK